MRANERRIAVVVGATSKWQGDGRNTKLAHGRELDDSHLPVGVRWGVGGAVAQKFASEGFFVVLTTRNAANNAPNDGLITWRPKQRVATPRSSPEPASRRPR